LIMSYQSQNNAKPGRCEESPILFVRNLPYLERHIRISCISSAWFCWSRRARQGIRTSPRMRGSSLVFSKNLTATSPVTTPIFSLSASLNSCPKTRFSSGVRFRLGAAVNTSAIKGPTTSCSVPLLDSKTCRRNSLVASDITLHLNDRMLESKQALTWVFGHSASASAPLYSAMRYESCRVSI